MNKKVLCATLSAVALFLGSFGTASALLGPPNGFTCDVTEDPIVLNWDSVSGADKYSVDFRCEMEVDVVTNTIEFSIGTSDAEGVGPISPPGLTLSIEEFSDAAMVDDITGYQCFAKVKALNPGKNRGRQNHTFTSPATDCGVVGAGE
jgi:hypothetical protein